MRVIAFVTTTPAAELSAAAPSEELLTEVGRLNEEMMAAGVLRGGEGLLPSATGVRVSVSDGTATTRTGPFTDSTHLVSGWWLLEVASVQEAAEWLARFPTAPGETATFEIRRIAESDDYGDALLEETRAREEAMRMRLGAH